MDTTTHTASQAICPVCHRPVARKPGRGRTKEVHTGCCIVRSRIAELQRLIGSMEFGDDQAVKMLRGDLFALVNNTLRATAVTVNPDNSADI